MAARPTGRAAVGRIFALTSALLLASIVFVTSSASANPAPVGLGTAATYSVLAGTAVSNDGLTTLSGDMGLISGSSTAVTGFPPGVTNGEI